jgi:hypothetical protein
MNEARRRALLPLAALLGAASASWAQQNAPHLAYVLPAGGQRGTTFQIVVGGQFLPNVNAAYVSGEGVEASVLEHARPMAPRQATELRTRLEELQKQPKDEAVRKEIAEIRTKLLVFASTRTTSPALAETVTLQIKMARNAAAGKRELRLRAPQGLSNPLVFCVGTLPETTEKEPAISLPPGPNQPQVSQAPTEIRVTLPAVVNGRIKPHWTRPQGQGRRDQQFTPGDADRIRFEARKGQQLVVAVSARELIPYLADAVPGWFQATVALFDADGKELAYDDDFRFHPDPVLQFQIPKDGDYAIEIKDALYRGREDFVYRIALGELPFVTGIFPLGGREGSRVSVPLTGWNLPTERLTVDAKKKTPGIYPVSVQKGELTSNSVPFAVDALPERIEDEPNDSKEKAERVKLPVVINGRIGKPGDWDVFAISGRAGEAIVAEVLARRLDSPLDSVLKLTDAAGEQLATNDDHEDKGSGLDTHHADSLLSATLPANGTYYLHLGDAQQKGGAEYAYRLRIGPPRPDFELRVVPSSINVAAGATVPLTVYALRRDGFAGDVALALKGAPGDFELSGAVLPAGQDKVRLTLTVSPEPSGEPVSIRLVGRGTIDGKQTLRTAVPADDMMQAFAYRHLVPAEDLKVVVTGTPGRRAARRTAKILGDQPLKVPVGGTARLAVELPPTRLGNTVQFELSEPPEGIGFKEAVVRQGGAALVFQSDSGKVKPGQRGNLIVLAFANRPAPETEGKPRANPRRVPLGALPAIPFEIVAP